MLTVSIASKENVGILANYVAFRVKADHFVDWWGAAANLQPDGEDAFAVAKHVFFERFPFERLSEQERALLEQSLVESSVA
jgi:hypothetical protein